jgi:hypothetical protein
MRKDFIVVILEKDRPSNGSGFTRTLAIMDRCAAPANCNGTDGLGWTFSCFREQWSIVMSDSNTTQDHNAIRRWAEARGGKPAQVAATGSASDAGILRLDFEPADEGLKPISWEQFFKKFDEEHLSFLYQEKTADGQTSRFHKFVNR